MRALIRLPQPHLPHLAHENFVSVGAVGLMLVLAAIVIGVFVAGFAVST